MYTIEINYKTGDSFHDENRTEKIGMAWKDYDKAKEALDRIYEHHDFWIGHFEDLHSAEIVLDKDTSSIEPNIFDMEYYVEEQFKGI